MPIFNVLALLVIAGLILWLINTYVPMAPMFKTVLNVVCVILLCLWLVNVFGLGDIRIPVRR